MTPEQMQRDAMFVRQMKRYHALTASQARPGGQSLEARFNPASIGARKAPDGHHYLADPTRPGKYLRVHWQ
jgi:hypothetical protein